MAIKSSLNMARIIAGSDGRGKIFPSIRSDGDPMNDCIDSQAFTEIERQ
jgi:hypothetical protein